MQRGQTVATTTLTVLNDTLPEDDEHIYVYLTSLTSGVRVARPSTDSGRKVTFFSNQVTDFMYAMSHWLLPPTRQITQYCVRFCMSIYVCL